MIRKFFQEHGVWYVIYGIMSLLYFLTFYLYRLPLSYFRTSLLFNLTFLIVMTCFLFLRFRKKMQQLDDTLYLQELTDFHSPTDRAYQDLLTRLMSAEKELGLTEKSRADSLQTMVKMWSHQMKVPISALSLMSQTNHLEKNEVKQQLIRLENYVDNLLNYMKFSQHKDDFRFEEVSVRPLVVDLVKKYRVPCMVKELSVTIDGDWILKSDKKWLRFAISQVLDNAVKYSRTGGQIVVQMDAGCLIIQDQGLGILEEDLPRLFEEGFTGFNGHEHQKATGLGLYMTKQVLDRLGIAIQVDSQIDIGTRVTFLTTEKS
ncbi:sensor histidine kinase [Streptococcus ovis]|uniref:sensor histidine kinase n=1 Tax=Streptococcus ovis TaxID=82806 RepID=UPI00037DD3D7|nr:sensor histidine kinase [Streptococcus ovis]